MIIFTVHEDTSMHSVHARQERPTTAHGTAQMAACLVYVRKVHWLAGAGLACRSIIAFNDMTNPADRPTATSVVP